MRKFAQGAISHMLLELCVASVPEHVTKSVHLSVTLGDLQKFKEKIS